MNFFCRRQNIAHREAISGIPIVIRIMKLVSLLIFILQIGVFANGRAQQVNISVKNAELKTVFAELNKQTRYRFLYNEETIQKALPVTFKVSNSDINTALSKALQGSGLGFRIHGETITILETDKMKPVAPMALTITGTVKDTSGLALPGVTVQVKNKPTIGTATDGNGAFVLKGVPEEAVLVFSLLSYKSQELPLNGRKVLNVVLRNDEANLNDVVVVGFGKQKKSSLVSSVASVKGDALRIPTRSLTNAIAGQVPGIIAIQRSGEPGYDNAEFWIRG
ncbi:STN domain-containing protein [Pedobacter riviphilus]|nr:STN domain-containing protein [Pedobacter riviphilus]